MIDFQIMASLNVIHKGGNNYLFTANGCHLEYFVIWSKDFRGKMKYTTESDDDDDGYY